MSATPSRAATRPHLRHEAVLWEAGLPCVAGIDEVGRGALAGPLVAAAVVLPACAGQARGGLARALGDVRDSKQLSPEQRERLVGPITRRALGVAVGVVQVWEIDQLGIGPANRLAMERAVLGLEREPDALLLDACVLDNGLPQVGLVDGDAISLSIAAASIVAKVARDRMMAELHDADPRYAFALHKGYGSPLHMQRLADHGPCPHHRRGFAPVAVLLAAR